MLKNKFLEGSVKINQVIRDFYTFSKLKYLKSILFLFSGTYLTLLNTIGNIGVKWPQTFSLWFVDIISWKRCIFDENNFNNSTDNTSNFLFDNKCENKAAKDVCIVNGGHCHTDIDGYYIEQAFYVIYGIIFYQFGKRIVDYLEKLPLDDWHILTKKVNNHELEKLNAVKKEEF
jgi:hypothetical protein